MTQQECEQQEHPHNNRCRYITGFYCEDCETLFPEDSPTFIRYELPANLRMAVWNVGADYVRAGHERPVEVSVLCEQLHELEKESDPKVREAILNAAYIFLHNHHYNPDKVFLKL